MNIPSSKRGKNCPESSRSIVRNSVPREVGCTMVRASTIKLLTVKKENRNMIWIKFTVNLPKLSSSDMLRKRNKESMHRLYSGMRRSITGSGQMALASRYWTTAQHDLTSTLRVADGDCFPLSNKMLAVRKSCCRRF